MGIHFLQTYIENQVPESCVPANIGYQCSKALTRGRSNVLIVDLMATVGKSYEGLNHFNGGDFAAFKERWKKFLKRCEDSGIKLIFVTDGVNLKSKRSTWVRRRYSSLENFVIPTFDALKKHYYPPEDIIHRSRILPCLMLSNLLRYEFGYKDSIFTSSPNQDADKACAALAETENAFGVLTEDTDFMALQFSVHTCVFSVKNLNMESLDTVLYDRSKLAANLGLELKQLPVFATLKGNDYISYEELRSFHYRLLGSKSRRMDYFDVIRSVASFVRRNLGGNIDYDRLAIQVFGYQENKPQVLKASVESYILNETDLNEPLGSCNFETKDTGWADLLNLHDNHNSKVFHLMCGAPYEQSTCLEDYRNTALPKVSHLFSGVRKRLYGILFYEKADALNAERSEFVISIEEWCMAGPESLDGPQWVKPTIPPTGSHPGLKELWKDRHRREFSESSPEKGTNYFLRWKLFSWIVHPLADRLLFQEIKGEDMYMVCQLFLMQHEPTQPILAEFEVKAFILMHLRLKSMSCQRHFELDFVPRPR